MRPVPYRPEVAFVGMGYVGLSTAVCFASRGISVLGVDVDKGRIETISKGVAPIHEDGLERLLRASIRDKKIRFSHTYQGLSKARVVFVTVGTPSRQDGGIDTEFVESASKEIGRQLSSVLGYRLVVVKSTVTPGTTEGVVRSIIERESKKEIGVGIGLAVNPEFLHEGSAIEETLRPEVIVIGGHDSRSTRALSRLYDAFYGRRFPAIYTTPSNAEMIKYAINAGRATQLSFVNTIADLCTRIPGADYDEVRKALSLVGRMDQRYLTAGMGFGGSCLPKDTRALSAVLKSHGVSDDLVASTLRVNERQVSEVLRLAGRHCGSLDGKKVSVLGLAFKAGTDDIRESVAISLVRALIRAGAEVSVYDPVAMPSAKQLLGSQVSYTRSLKECVRGSECAMIATGWNSFKNLNPQDLKSLMKSPVVIDGRRLLSQDRFLKAGIEIETIGTGPRSTSSQVGGKTKPGKEWHYVVKDGVTSSISEAPQFR